MNTLFLLCGLQCLHFSMSNCTAREKDIIALSFISCFSRNWCKLEICQVDVSLGHVQATLCNFGRLWKNINFQKWQDLKYCQHNTKISPTPQPPFPKSFPAQVLKYLNAYIINYLFSIWLHFSPCSCETSTCNETLPNSIGGCQKMEVLCISNICRGIYN